MPASSSNSSSASKTYDVFVNFRGADTRRNFICHLGEALKKNAITAFIDSITKGEDILFSIIANGIRDSYGSIIVFSENYAYSRWCLNELLLILERRKEGHFVIPVFYDIDPSHVRGQTGPYMEAFAKHEAYTSEDKLQLWRSALTEAANIAGWNSVSHRDEHELIQNIVNDILQRMNDIYQPSESSFVGMEKYFNDIASLLQRSLIVGIWGMGGIGKTTIAKAIFDKLCFQYDSYYFFENVKEESEKNGLNYIRDKLLSELLKHENFSSITPNTPAFKFVMRRLSRKKVLFVLDDVNSSKQLDLLQQVGNCLGVDSKVIITTRDKHVLASLRVDHEMYEVRGLNFENSLQLFSLEAFNENYPKRGYEEITRKLVYYPKGIPLALKDLGSFLRSKPKEEWEGVLARLQKVPHDDIEKVLRLICDGSSLRREKSSMSIKSQVEKLMIHPNFWRFVGFVSSTVGLLCFALSLSFQRLFGRWNIWKFSLYGAVGFIITGFMLLPKKKWRLPRRSWLKIHIVFFVFVFTSLGSFFYDKWKSGKPDRLGLSSIGLFALSSFSLSRQIDVGFEVGFTNFLLATFIAQILQTNQHLVYLPVAASFAIFAVRTYLESRTKDTVTPRIQEPVTVYIDN